MKDEIAANPQSKNSLNVFAKTIFDNKHILQLEPNTITVLLAIHYQQSSNLANNTDLSPSICRLSLANITGMQESDITCTLDTLYENGFISRESYFSEGHEQRIYRMRDREYFLNPDGNIEGEISWVRQLPFNPGDIQEFRDILYSDHKTETRIIHIEKMQVNLTADRDLISQHTHLSKNDEKNINHEEPISTPNTANINSSDNTVKNNTTTNVDVSALLDEYGERLKGEFKLALNNARTNLENINTEQLKHEVNKPTMPVGLWLLVKRRNWRQKQRAWKMKFDNLKQSQMHAISEIQRLESALSTGKNDTPPLYLQEAIQQIKQDHPNLSEEFDVHNLVLNQQASV